MRAVLVVKDKEPQVVSLKKGSYEEFSDILKEELSEQERSIAPFNSVESFIIGLDGVIGYVEGRSCLHPYERNRHWHGPALFVEYDYEGDTIDMSDENIEEVKRRFSLDNTASSPSTYINEFLDKYTRQVTHNVTIGCNHGVLNTLDAADFIRNAQDPEAIADITDVLKHLEQYSEVSGIAIEELFTDYLKELNKHLFSESIKNSDIHTFFEL